MTELCCRAIFIDESLSEKKRVSCECGQSPAQSRAVDSSQRGLEPVLDQFHLSRSCSLPLFAERSEGRAHDASVCGIVDPTDEAIGLQPIHELRHVRPHAAGTGGELA